MSGLSEAQFERTFQIITERITFVDEILLSDKDIQKALHLVNDIDEEDALFVALANHLKSKLWTGDKKLIKGLKEKGYNKTLSTEELYQLFLKKELQEKLRRKNR
ncbi:PIN domain-containing protein [Cytophagales bacterium LB-30]|uniref:PIN domain-containing protein n=1 Tax=Shiella aurantiaca TaxID=3058365 RepID=A0ABT8F4H4_9BACT|nr:PIN domain-containing protein [Shiella aurantiaca]MDN4165373.1 PIN domain-containing protein [Shiella aurantiaca]